MTTAVMGIRLSVIRGPPLLSAGGTRGRVRWLVGALGKGLAAAAHPADVARRVADDERVRTDGTGHDSSRPDHRVGPDIASAHDRGIRTNRRTLADDRADDRPMCVVC